ncbi:MAG: pyridoxamine 5'-phosphate oxidase family protein [Candidatus Bathyarchaeota archaeon]|nr:pyridoxamine 5'-phosphate oxidase family protein [Candidatus Bathyarchaeota archaeon]
MVKTYHMRRGDKEIKDKAKLGRILKETNYVTLALANGNEPYIVALSHSYDEEAGCLYFHCSSEGKKLDYMRANPVVWGQALIDHGYSEGNCSHLYVSAVFRGRIEWVESLDEKRRVLKHMIERQDKNPAALMPRLTGVDSSGALAKTVVGKIVLLELTGKKSAEVTF